MSAGDSNEIEVFKEDLAINMQYLAANIDMVNEENRRFAKSLCEWWAEHDSLTVKQLPYALKFWRQVMDSPAVMRKGIR